jgi:hypothetical protein
VATVLCVLYDDPVDGYPPALARDGIPAIEGYFDGQTAPSPQGIDFTPGELLGCVSGERPGHARHRSPPATCAGAARRAGISRRGRRARPRLERGRVKAVGCRAFERAVQT